jgi:hypothetical protein
MSLLKVIWSVTAFLLVSDVVCDDSWTTDPSENQFKCQRRCQPEFEYMNGNCYYFAKNGTDNIRRLFDDTEKICEQKGSHLASVHSVGENNYILSKSGDNIFLNFVTVFVPEYLHL